jgi:hypothetical protein
MVRKKILVNERVRRVKGSFAFLEHRFLRSGFWNQLDQDELLLYFFLVMVADRDGLSYYPYDKICSLLHFTLEQYLGARGGLINKDLLAFDGTIFQVLSLPGQSTVCQSKNFSDELSYAE